MLRSALEANPASTKSAFTSLAISEAVPSTMPMYLGDECQHSSARRQTILLIESRFLLFANGPAALPEIKAAPAVARELIWLTRNSP
jgi:hypothetical protein